MHGCGVWLSTFAFANRMEDANLPNVPCVLKTSGLNPVMAPGPAGLTPMLLTIWGRYVGFGQNRVANGCLEIDSLGVIAGYGAAS